MATRAGGRLASGGIIAGSLVMLALLPTSAGRAVVPTLTLGLLVAMAIAGGMLLAATAMSAVSADRAEISGVLDALLLWSGCAVALCAVTGAVATTAETLQLDSVVLAQEYTRLFVLQQPAGALIYVAAVALAGRGAALAVVLGPPSAARTAAGLALLLAMSALGATLFAGGYSGTGLPALAWLGAKTLTTLAVILALRAGAGRLGGGARIALAWGAAALALLNLAVAFALAIR